LYEVLHFVQSCFLYQTCKTPPLAKAGLLQSIETTDMFDTIGIDFAGPFPESPEGYRYILIGICLFSKWVVTKPVKEATAEEVVKFIIGNFISRHGFIKKLISGKGSQMTSKLYK
jgi:hypothetical protein